MSSIVEQGPPIPRQWIIKYVRSLREQASKDTGEVRDYLIAQAQAIEILVRSWDKRKS